MAVRTLQAGLVALALATAPFGCGREPREPRDRAEREGERNRELVVTATAYTSHPEQTSGDPFLTASGERLEPGMKALAVSPDLARRGLDFGTRVRIDGIDGTWKVLDRMPQGTRRIDLWFGRDKEAAKRFGERRVRISWEAP